MSKLQENGRERKGDEKKRGEIGKVGYLMLSSPIFIQGHSIFSWSFEKASRKAAIKKLHKKLQRGRIL